MTEAETPNLRIYLAGGQEITTFDPDLPEGNAQALEEISERLNKYGRPYWACFGDVWVFTQGVSAIELA